MSPRQAGQPGETKQPDLFEYGIHLENSDIRAHVSVVDKTIYVFKTSCGIEAIERTNPRLADASQPGVEGRTAEGWLVRVVDVKDLRKLKFESWHGWSFFDAGLSTTEKGRLAVQCVVEAMKLGRFPFWLDGFEDSRENIQIKGTDIVIFCRKKVQVKCDYRVGETGNLYLQKAERNPLRAR